MRIGATQQVAIFLENERGIELSRSGNDEFRCRSDGVQHRAGTDARDGWSPAAVSAEYVVGSNATTAETTVDRLHLDRLVAQCRRRHSVTHSPGQQLLEMIREFVAQLARRAITILRFVLDRSHQDVFHLTRDRRLNLTRSRVLRAVKNKKRFVLR